MMTDPHWARLLTRIPGYNDPDPDPFAEDDLKEAS